MIDNRKLLAIVIVLSLVGVISLFFYSASIKPKQVGISEMNENLVGSLVQLNGTISRISTFDSGATSIELVDLGTNATITIFLNADISEVWLSTADPIPGATLEATGVVEIYNDEYEIVIGTSEDIKIIEPATSNSVQIWQLLASPEIFDGMTVAVKGEVRSYDTISGGAIFNLRAEQDNSTYYLSCVVFEDDIVKDLGNGISVEVIGEFGYYQNMGNWQVVVDGEENVTIINH